MAKKSFYTIWSGHQIGVVSTWEECKALTDGYSNAHFEGFLTYEEALAAFKMGFEEYQRRKNLVDDETKEGDLF